MAHKFLLDGFNLAFRSFYAVADLSRSDGFPTNALHGWVRTLWKLEDTEKPDQIIAFFDSGRSVRHTTLLPEYKDNRSETPPALKQQIPWIKEITSAMGHSVIDRSEIEADDLIASAAIQEVNAGHQITIVSADKDLAQCVQPGIEQLLPPPTVNPRVGWRRLNVMGVKQKFGVLPEQIPDYLALTGDASDNIPGLKGVGPKTAVKWILQFGSLEKLIERWDWVKPDRFRLIVREAAPLLRRNLQLIKLQTYQKIVFLKAHLEKNKLLRIFQEMEMRTTFQEAERRYRLEN